MKKMGFTLVELIAVITIMAILLIMIVPSINRLQNQNKSKAYELYAESAIRAAKLYVEDAREGLTGYTSWRGCVSIPYQKLIEADLLKPFSNKRYNCSNLEVRVYKDTTATMTFAYKLVCYDTEKGNEQVYSQSTLKSGGCYASTNN